MTKADFQKRYHQFETQNGDTAKAEAQKVNAEGIDNDSAEAIEFPGLGWCLMLASSAKLLRSSEII